MIRARMLPIHFLKIFIGSGSLIFTIWVLVNSINGNIITVGWDNKVYPPDSPYAILADVFLVLFFCYVAYITIVSLRKERILYMRSSREKKLATTDSSGSNTISDIRRYELGKCLVAIRWIPPNLGVARIKAFHVYKTRRFRPFAKFKVSVVNNDEYVVGEIKQYVSTSETFRSDRWGRDTIEFSPPQDSDTFDIKIYVTSQYYKEGDPRQEKYPPPDHEEYQIWVWWGLTIKEWLELKRLQK